MKDDKENDIEMNDGDSTESPADGNNMHANPESEKKPHNRKVIAAICGLALVALIGGGAYYGIGHQTDADSKAESVQANDSKESGSDASAKDGSKSKEKSHTHDWSITYKTVHHDAVTHTEHVAPVYQNLTTYHTVCNECKQVIDGKADDHIKQTGHSGYSTNVPITDEVMVSEGYDKQVTDTPAYDETVIDKLVCTTCGATKDPTSSKPHRRQTMQTPSSWSATRRSLERTSRLTHRNWKRRYRSPGRVMTWQAHPNTSRKARCQKMFSPPFCNMRLPKRTCVQFLYCRNTGIIV